MKANTAVGVLLAGVALCLLGAQRSPRRRWIGHAFALVVTLLGFATLGEYVYDWQLGIDEFLFSDTANALNAVRGRMSPYSAVSFACVGLGITALSWPSLRWFVWVTATLTILIGGISCIGYMWRANELVTDRYVLPVAVNAAMAFILLGVSMFAATLEATEGIRRPWASLSKIESKTLTGFLATLVLLLAAGGYTYRAAIDESNSARWMAHAQQVRASDGRLFAAISDAESCQRNYLFSGDAKYREEYERHAVEAVRQARALAGLVANDPLQLQRSKDLQVFVDERMRTLAQTVAIFEQSGLAAAKAVIAEGEGIRAMAGIRSVIKQVDAAEEQRLALREVGASRQKIKTLVAMLLSVAAAVAGFMVLFNGIRRELASRTQAEETLRRSEESLAVTLHSIGDAVLATDTRGNITRMNRVAEQLTGWTFTEARGRPVGEVFRIINEETRSPAPIPVNNVLATGEIQGQADATVLIARDGTERAIANSAAPIRDSEARILGVVLAFRDVTESRQAQAELDRFFSLSLDFLCIASADGYFKRVSPAVTDILGWSNQEILARPFLDFIHPDDHLATLHEVTRQVVAGEKVLNFENRYRHKDGTWRVLSWRSVPQPGGLMYAAARDITEQKSRDAALRESEQRLRSIVDNTAAFVGEMTPDGVMIEINSTALQAGALTREDVIGKRLDEIWFFSGSTAAQAQIRADIERARSGERVRHDMEVRMAGGVPLPMDFMLVPVHDTTGKLVKLIPSGIDISARKRAEESLHRANVELERASRLKDEFLANMSHELRTPLNAILGMSEALLEQTGGTLTPQQAQSITTISTSGQHLLSLINDILDLSKIEAGKFELQPEQLDVVEFCQSCMVFVRMQAMQKRISVAFEFDGRAAKFRADPKRFKQVLVNLLTNAVKFTPEGGRIGLTVSAPEVEDMMRFTVWDTGIGIASGDHQKLFRAFTQIDSGLARMQEGTGLGLALVAKMMELHGGSVALESDLGKGSRFMVTLPRSPGYSLEVVPQVQPDRRGYRRALIIEDDPHASEQLERYLTELGIAAIVHGRGEDSVEVALRQRPDVILLDIQLPKESGWVVLARLQGNHGTRHIPVVVISVVDEPQKARALGAAAYFIKPVTRELLAKFLHRDVVKPIRSSAPFEVRAPRDGTPILLAEDTAANRETVGGYLEDKGYRLHYALNGREAVQLAHQLHPALILMDIQMPVMDGLAATKEIRTNGALQSIPIVALTALAMPGDRERCLAAGATDYLSKPVSLKALVATVERLLAKNMPRNNDTTVTPIFFRRSEPIMEADEPCEIISQATKTLVV